MRITIASGKGGVGKSMIASAVAMLYSKENEVIAVDCDVDAPNLAIWIGIDTSDPLTARMAKDISTVEKPKINVDKCTGCGICVEKCRFNALELNKQNKASVISYRCEGCGLCEIVCPHDAITMKPVNNCALRVFDSEWGFPVVQGQIKPGEAESGEAVTEIRKYAESIGSENTLYIQDAAAGIGCPVIASIVGSDYVVAVAEPSLSSLSDVQRVIKVVEQFNVPWGVVVNKVGLNKDVYNKIQKFAGKKLLGTISYNAKIFNVVSELTPILESDLDTKDELGVVYNALKKVIQKKD